MPLDRATRHGRRSPRRSLKSCWLASIAPSCKHLTMLVSHPRNFDAKLLLQGVHWHQGWEVFPGVWTPGPSTVHVIMTQVGLPADLTGKRVLDIGAWNGCFSFECERRGAREVIALSLEHPDCSGFNRLKTLLEAHNLEPSMFAARSITLIRKKSGSSISSFVSA